MPLLPDPVLASADLRVRHGLAAWPQCPPGFDNGEGGWMRARPTLGKGVCPPFLKLPGCERRRTWPDGLWLRLGGKRGEPFADLLVIEACGTMPNLLDKRSRFSPSMHSWLVECPESWLHAPLDPSDPRPRWCVTGLWKSPPKGPVIAPVRDIRVFYGLTQADLRSFRRDQLPHAHERFLPMEVLADKRAPWRASVRAFFAQASLRANFLDPDGPVSDTLH